MQVKMQLNCSWMYFSYNLAWKELPLPTDTARSLTHLIRYQMNAVLKLNQNSKEKLHILSWPVSSGTLRKYHFVHLWEKLLVYPIVIKTDIKQEGVKMQCKTSSFVHFTTTTTILGSICLCRLSQQGPLGITCNCLQTVGFQFSFFS